MAHIVNEAHAEKPIRWVSAWYKAMHGRWARKFIDAIGNEGWRVGPEWRLNQPTKAGL